MGVAIGVRHPSKARDPNCHKDETFYVPKSYIQRKLFPSLEIEGRGDLQIEGFIQNPLPQPQKVRPIDLAHPCDSGHPNLGVGPHNLQSWLGVVAPKA